MEFSSREGKKDRITGEKRETLRHNRSERIEEEERREILYAQERKDRLEVEA